MPQGPEPEGSSVGGTSVMSQYLGYAATMPDLAVWYRWAEASMPMGIVAKRPTPQAITPTNAIRPQTNVPINIGPFVVIWIDFLMASMGDPPSSMATNTECHARTLKMSPGMMQAM